MSRSLAAQSPPSAQFIDVGSERERILRVLQLVGDVRPYPWSIRAFSPHERDLLTPKSGRGEAFLPSESKTRGDGNFVAVILPSESQGAFNSTFPFGYNDGALWVGRGFTGSVSGGVAARVGPLSLQIEPLIFATQNQSAPLLVNPTALSPFADGVHPLEIDQPQRFGSGAYSRFDWGQSAVRLDGGPVFAEFSTANQWWGPAVEEPLILGNNAPGFPHVALGTAHPVNIWIGSLHGRVMWGRLSQTRFSPDLENPTRFASGAVGVFVPRGVPGLEIGAARFFHSSWPDSGIRHARFGLPFEGILKKQLTDPNNPLGLDVDNQLASVFARWAFAPVGFEVYGEFAREDHNQDLRDFWLEPDHIAGYSLGAQRVWRLGDSTLAAGRFEILNTRISHLEQGRSQGPFYVHSAFLTQGHTQLGQVLGAPGALGGGAGILAFDWYKPAERWSLGWTRLIRATEIAGPVRRRDVLHALEFEGRREFGRLTYSGTAGAVWDLNRNFAGDQFSLSLRAAARATF
jgi:hypothetical protein